MDAHVHDRGAGLHPLAGHGLRPADRRHQQIRLARELASAGARSRCGRSVTVMSTPLLDEQASRAGGRRSVLRPSTTAWRPASGTW